MHSPLFESLDTLTDNSLLKMSQSSTALMFTPLQSNSLHQLLLLIPDAIVDGRRIRAQLNIFVNITLVSLYRKITDMLEVCYQEHILPSDGVSVDIHLDFQDTSACVSTKFSMNNKEGLQEQAPNRHVRVIFLTPILFQSFRPYFIGQSFGHTFKSCPGQMTTFHIVDIMCSMSLSKDIDIFDLPAHFFHS